jgi:glycosyltransferase involved in cell wall biosynthesis
MMAGSGGILALEPYYGGSHRSFLDGLAGVVPGNLELITLPAHRWKLRMRLAAPWLARELTRLGEKEDPAGYRALLCSTFVDVAALRGLAPPWAAALPVCTYFHENQFAYPVRIEDGRDLHFGLTNFTTALATDRLAFNSTYNLESFLAGCRELSEIAPEMKLPGIEAQLRDKSTVLPPGQDFSTIDQAPEAGLRSRPVIVWNHRWEHDKNPEEFFAALFALQDSGCDFGLIVLGQSFREAPPIFAEARIRLAGRIRQFGYAETPEQYAAWLKQGDVVVSTARHEFFGISVIEAVRGGCRPVLPDRLSYPELFPAEYLYAPGELLKHLRAALSAGRLEQETARSLTERFSWSNLGAAYREWLGLNQ